MRTARRNRRRVAPSPVPAPHGSRAAAVPSALVFLTAAWLTAAPLVWEPQTPANGLAAGANEVGAGAALMTIALVRVTFPLVTALLSIVNALLGVWLVASPFVLGYRLDSGMTTNNVIVGVVVAVLATTSWFTARFIITADNARPTRSPHSR